jgi:hypothetical protein
MMWVCNALYKNLYFPICHFCKICFDVHVTNHNKAWCFFGNLSASCVFVCRSLGSNPNNNSPILMKLGMNNMSFEESHNFTSQLPNPSNTNKATARTNEEKPMLVQVSEIMRLSMMMRI